MTLVAIFLLYFLFNFVLISSNETHKTHIVFMDRSKMEALDASLGTSRSWHEYVIESIREDGEQQGPTLHYIYDQTMHGFSAKLNDQHLQTLKEIDGFLGSIEDKPIPLHTTHSPDFLGLEVGKGLWGSPNLASDVIIGVVDTGIWPESSSFHDTNISEVPSRWKGSCEDYSSFKASSCNKKLIGAKLFLKGYESKNGKINGTLGYRSPRDSFGHGTHTASTAGGNFVRNVNIFGMANGTAAGMSPTARIAAYKACFDDQCFDSDLLAAINEAVKDGVDVLSLSLGGPPIPYHSDIMALGTFGAVQKGVVVSVSAGNLGPNLFTVQNAAPWYTTVAASTTDRDFLADVQLGNGTIMLSGASISLPKTINNMPLVYNQTIGGNLCLDGSLSPKSVYGKIVMCDRGNNSRVAKGEEVKRAGGVAMILANVEDYIGDEGTILDPHVLPTVALNASAAEIIRSYAISSNNPMATIKFRGTVYKNRAPVMAQFSSRGPNTIDSNILKPDITAPGVKILAAYPPNISPSLFKTDKRRVSFNLMSGTSMSCPHVSGILALVKSVHRDWSPAAIKSALMTTAYFLDSHNSPISDMSDGKSPDATPFAYGSGHVDANKASDPGLIYDIPPQDYFSYLCTLNYNSTEMKLFTHSNKSSCDARSRFRAGDLNYPSFSVVFGNQSTITYKRTVTNVGSSGVITYRVNVNEPEGVSITVKPDTLEFNRVKQCLNYNVTFTATSMSAASTNFSFGYINWVSGDYNVRSPIVVIWKLK